MKESRRQNILDGLIDGHSQYSCRSRRERRRLGQWLLIKKSWIAHERERSRGEKQTNHS
jgi:hypothetical protein